MAHNALILSSAALPAAAPDRRRLGLSTQHTPRRARRGPRGVLQGDGEIWRCVRLQDLPARTAAALAGAMRRAGGHALPAPRARAMLLAGGPGAFAALIESAVRRTMTRAAAREIEAALERFAARPRALGLRNGRLSLRRTLVMGILNVTPDSFSDGGAHRSVRRAVARALAMADEGADIIDLGGESTRPGALPVPLEEELRRVLPVLEALGPALARRRSRRPLLSIDTTKAEVARRAAVLGADIINDVSGLTADPAMPAAAAASRLALVVSHIRGRPRRMQRAPRYRHLLPEIAAFLRRSVGLALAAGVREERIVIDPGIGFGKRLADNLSILGHLAVFRSLGRPILIGVSRKAFIGGVLDLPVSERLEGSLAAEALCVAGGADIIRAHDVRPAVRVARLCDAVSGGRAGGS